MLHYYNEPNRLLLFRIDIKSNKKLLTRHLNHNLRGAIWREASRKSKIFLAEEFFIEPVQATTVKGHELVVVVNVETAMPHEAVARERQCQVLERRVDATQVEQCVKDDHVGRDWNGSMLLELRDGIRVLLGKTLRSPHQQGHSQLEIGGLWRGVKEALPAVVEDVFAMVAGEDHSTAHVLAAHLADNGRKHLVGVADGVVVGINQLPAVDVLGRDHIVGLEKSLILGISVFVVEV